MNKLNKHTDFYYDLINIVNIQIRSLCFSPKLHSAPLSLTFVQFPEGFHSHIMNIRYQNIQFKQSTEL